MRRFVRTIIKNPEGKILMVYNIKSGNWNFPGGKVEPDEKPSAAAVRETKEEVNLKITELKKVLVCYVYFPGKPEPRGGHYFKGKAELSKLRLNEPDKITKADFFTKNEIRTIPNLSLAVQVWLNKGQKEQ